MSHYKIDYNPATTPPQVVHERCIQDIKEWLGNLPDGQSRYEAITAELRKECPQRSYESFRFLASFAGVQGRPVQAWYAEVYPYG